MAEEARIVRLLLETIKQEFPDYHSDNDSLVAVCVALAAVTGAMGAFCLLKGGEARLDKMLRMIATRANEMAHAGVKALQKTGQTNEVLREGGPLSPDEVLRRVLAKGGRLN